MKIIQQLRTKGVTIALVATSVLLLPACDPSTLTLEQRQLVTGTTDVGTVTLTVDDPIEVTLETEAHEFKYHAAAVGGFKGTFTLSLSGLTPDIELMKDISHETFKSDTLLDGSFIVRALATRPDPVDLRLTVTSIGTAGSRVGQSVAIRLHLQGPSAPAARPVEVDCRRQPASGAAPLAVTFEARVSGCTGRCRFRWEFGDGATDEQRQVEHVFTRPGEYNAVGTLNDGAGRTATCVTDVVVTKPAPGPSPTPAPTPAPSPTSPSTGSLRPGTSDVR
jgi:PKD repeat protein